MSHEPASFYISYHPTCEAVQVLSTHDVPHLLFDQLFLWNPICWAVQGKKTKHSKQIHVPDTKPDAIICIHKRHNMEKSSGLLTLVFHRPSALTPDHSWPPTHWGRSGLTLCAGDSVEPIQGRFLGSPLLWVHARSSHVTPAALTLQQQRVEMTGSTDHLNERWVMF